MADGRLAAVLVVGFVVFVGFGVAFVGTDDTPTEGEQPDEGTQDSTETIEVPVANTSIEDGPYADRADYTDPDFSDLNTTEVERLVAERTNEVRTNRSVGNVSFSETLAVPARQHSYNMSEMGYIGHVNPAGGSVEDRYIDECDALREGREEFEYSENVAVVWYKKVFASSLSGENVYVRSEEGVAELLVDEWLASETHRQNMVKSKWDSIGVGVTVDENGTVFGTQAFCSVGG